MMECAAKGRGTRCTGPATRPCARCGAVAYCSLSHQVLNSFLPMFSFRVLCNWVSEFLLGVLGLVDLKIGTRFARYRKNAEHLKLDCDSYSFTHPIAHWSHHKQECDRLEQQMKSVDVLNDYPFTFSREATFQVCVKQETRCSFLSKRSLHQVGMWMHECHCGASCTSFDYLRLNNGWVLPSILCPCSGPESPISEQLRGWRDYYKWRCIPLDSPVAVLLHWPLTIYHAAQLAGITALNPEVSNKLYIHYLGPEKELLQLGVFGELLALFPGVHIHIELVGPAVPPHRKQGW